MSDTRSVDDIEKDRKELFEKLANAEYNLNAYESNKRLLKASLLYIERELKEALARMELREERLHASEGEEHSHPVVTKHGGYAGEKPCDGCDE